MSKKILLTFDYELFLKQSGTPEKCMLEPSDAILKSFAKHQIRGTFFIDILYLLRLKESTKGQETYKKIAAQLCEMLRQGNRIELHLHPHWLDAQEENGQWKFENLRYYKFQALLQDKAKELFQTGVEMLLEIAHQQDSNYKLHAFRAGGLCIQPFSVFKKLFRDHQIKVDSSVAAHLFTTTKAQSYDFREAPNKDWYHFEDEPARENPNGQFLEIPISVYQRGVGEKIREKLMGNKAKHSSIFGDGKGLSPNAELPSGFVAKLRSALRSYPMTYSLDMVNPEILTDRVKRSTHEYINILSHPKLMTKESLRAINLLAGLDVTFLSMKEMGDALER